MKYLHITLIALTMTACQMGKRPTPEAGDFVPSCGKDQFMGLIGQDGATLRDVDLPPATRVVKPGMALTMDYRPDRLNVSINKAGKIDRVWCS